MKVKAIGGFMLASCLAVAACAPSTGTAGGKEGDAGSGSGTVKMVLWPGPEGEAMDQVVKEYNEGPGAEADITVEMTLLSRQDTFSKEATLMAAKSSEQDIYFVASYNVGQFANALDPLTSVDASNYFPVAAEGLSYEDEPYALPLDVSNHFLYYRKDLIDDLLADEDRWPKYRKVAAEAIDEERDPKSPEEWDWQDYIAMSAWFSKSANPDSPTKYGTILQAKNLLYNTMIFDDLLWGEGGSWTTEDGKANLDTPEAERALNTYRTIYENGWAPKDSSQAEFPETQAALKSGNTAFALQWSAGFSELDDKEQSPKVAGKMAIAPVPGHKTHVHALAVALNKYSENKEAATTFLDYLATPEAMGTYAEAGGIPAMPAVLEEKASINPAFDDITTSINEYGYSVPVFPNTFEAYSSIAENLSGAWVGETDPKEALTKANADLQKLLE